MAGESALIVAGFARCAGREARTTGTGRIVERGTALIVVRSAHSGGRIVELGMAREAVRGGG